ncbi:replicative DNA helicase [Ectobacillus panaciterrae]|uniref:replicative DNA helicase n=1 Tax=Ectobacillus panaciterrae TaxID=363872 RepID=UPI00041E3C97|nr:replicative DNA helicase [Ectobacillus panaciterrae]
MSIQSVEAERTVLGSLLLDGELMKECRLTEEHFSVTMHRALFKLMRQIDGDGDPLDLITLVSKLDSAFLEQIGGIVYFVNIMESVPTTANFSHYERLVRNSWKMRHAIRMAQNMNEQLLIDKDEKIIGKTISALSELENTEDTFDFELKDALIRLYEDLNKDTGELTGIDTGFKRLNEITCGLQEEEFIVIGARPSMGKTAFALNLALHAAKSGTAVGIFSLEMSEKQLIKRMISCIGNVPAKKLRNPKHLFSIPDWQQTSQALAEIGTLPLEIYDRAGVTTQDIWMQVRKLKRKHPGKKLLVVIDYLQLITGDSKYRGNRMQEIGEISRKLKLMARDLNVCVVALSQLSRGVESRQDKRPLLSDLRETGQIEQDADVIMLMYREDYYDRETENKEVTEIHVAKQRNGPIGTVRLRFVREYGKFVGMKK